jgi:hypothetical protein
MEVIMGCQRELRVRHGRETNQVVLIGQVHFSDVFDAKIAQQMGGSQFLKEH